MKDKKEIDYYEVLTELADCIQTSINLKKGTLEYLNPEFQKHEIEFEKKCIAKMEKQIEAINHAINMIYS